MSDDTGRQPPSPRPTSRRIGPWVFFGLMGFNLILFEATVRIVKPVSLQPEYTVIHEDYNHRLNPGIAAAGEVGPEKYPVFLRVNAQALAQDGEVPIPKPADVYRILIIGDSMIQGLAVGKTLPAFVEAGLAQWRTHDGRRLEVINGGTQSYSPLLYAARYLHQYEEMQPDAVIIFPDLTDVYDDNTRYEHLSEFVDGDLVRVRPSEAMAIEQRTKRRLLYHDVPSHFYKYVVAKFAYLRAVNSALKESWAGIYEHALDDESSPRPETLEAVGYSIANMRWFINHLLSNDVHVAIMIYPHRGQIVPQTYDDATGEKVMLNRLFERSLERLGSELDVAFASYYDRMSREIEQGRQIYIVGDMHFNVEGLSTLSSSVSDTILESSEETIGVTISPRE